MADMVSTTNATSGSVGYHGEPEALRAMADSTANVGMTRKRTRHTTNSALASDSPIVNAEMRAPRPADAASFTLLNNLSPVLVLVVSVAPLPTASA
eukprot:CAMPEP_0197618816 /NCGR_PEP_ID=MMETSP1326-20131121/61727_1 /TAXON_ID=1155430 /ORGANISM="Genus nov. species nov., Strain RCC2288" /LENGTH=95 /DNA_ID=CAMNT_0043187717 /DNA_START=456 /DNA_END=740 /DNA_ORIENTATION=+